MKNFKKVLLTGTITLATLFAMSVISSAATVKITGEVVNMRRSNSTGSKVVAQLSENVECEYLGEEGNWYKVKYKNYTGYVSKDYAKLVGETSNNQNSNNNQSNNNQSNSQTNNNDNKDDNKNNTQTNNNQASNSDNNKEQNNNSQSVDDSQKEDTVKLTYKKFNANTIIRILPLIHSSNIGEAKKNEEVLVLAETSGWTYIQTDEISGWVRTDTLGSSKNVTTGSSSQGTGSTTSSISTTSTNRTGYISEEEVNLRKGAGTSYAVLKTLKLNAQVTILKEEGKWYQVKSGNTTGYVSKDYVSDSKTVSNRSLSEPREEDKTVEKEDSKDTNKVIVSATSDMKTSNKTTTSNKTDSNKTNSTTSDKTTSSNKTDNKNTSNTTSDKTTTTNKNQTTSSKDTIKGTDVIAYAKKYLGHKYVWAADGSNGTFDCSGFTMYVYKHFGVSLPHYTVSQYNSSKGKKITKQSELKMGDIVFLTDYETGAPCGHCGIYIGDGDFIHADSSVGYVNISNLNGIYKGRFCGALRIIK